MIPQRAHDLLAMSRFANLPTVWSNALLGFLVAHLFFRVELAHSAAGLLLLGLSALYLGGCFLNDWQDAEFDAAHRPDRPIPSGRWPRRTIGLLALALLLGGLTLIFAASPLAALFALGITACILIYTKWHKTHPFSLLFMAGARALIYPTCIFAPLTLAEFHTLTLAQVPAVITFALALASYILGISLTARFEAQKSLPEQTPVIPFICLGLPVFFVSVFLALAGNPLAALTPMALFIIVQMIIVNRLRHTGNIGAFVSAALAAIPLVDALFVMHLGLTAGNLPLILACPALALLALGLQKIAPAT